METKSPRAEGVTQVLSKVQSRHHLQCVERQTGARGKLSSVAHAKSTDRKSERNLVLAAVIHADSKIASRLTARTSRRRTSQKQVEGLTSDTTSCEGAGVDEGTPRTEIACIDLGIFHATWFAVRRVKSRREKAWLA